MSAQENPKQNLSQLYQIGDFIDAKDNQGDWRVGFIIDKSQNNKLFKVRFDGWASKYDQFYKFGNPKLVQFRKILIGYTGQMQNPATRPSWKFSLQQHEEKLIELSKITSKKKEQIPNFFENAHKLNQYLRGHNYLYVDFLMTNAYDNIQTINRIIEYFKLNFYLLKNYLTHVYQNFNEFIPSLESSNANKKYLQDASNAYQWSFFQIFDTIFIIMGNCPRSNFFFKENQNLLREYFQIQGKDHKLGFQIKMTETLLNLKIFQVLQKILQRLTQFQSNSKQTIPFVFLLSLAHLYKGISVVIQPKSKQSTIKKLQKVGNANIAKLGDKQMKDFHKRDALQFLNCIQKISEGSANHENIQKWLINMQLQIYYKMITCPLFDKKLKGINAIQELCQAKQNISTDGTMEKWIQGKKILQILFLNDNPQIIKKSSEMIKYLYSKDPDFERFIVQIWNHRHGKHQTAIKQIYSLIGEVPLHAQHQSSNFSIKLFNLISQVPQKEWDQEYIKMIYNYSINALFMTIPSQKQNKFGFDIIYNYLKQGVSSEQANIMDYLIKILQKFQNTEFLNQFVLQCFQKISSNQQQNLYVSLLLKMLKQKIGSLKEVKVDMRAIIQRSIIDFRDEQKQNTIQKFELLSEVLKNITQAIPKQQFIQFWHKMISSKSRSIFFSWLYKLRDNGRVILTSYINFETKKAVLQIFWTDQYLNVCPEIDEEEIRFLIQLFKYVNAYQTKLQRAQMLIISLNSPSQLNSLEKLWKIFESTKSQKISSMLSAVITQVYMCKYITRDNNLIEEQDLVLKQFIQIISIKLKLYLSENNISKINKMLILIEQVLKADQEIFEIDQTIKVCVLKDYIIKNRENSQEKTIRYNLGQSLYNFKKAIAEKFNLQINKFDLLNAKNERLNYKCYFKSLVELQVPNKLQLELRPNVESQAKRLLNHQLELLFELLGVKQMQQKVWNIVSKLPISDQLQHKIVQSKNPLQTLKQESLYKQLYLLKVALSLQNKFWERIQFKKGWLYFLDKLNKVFSSQIQREYLLVVLQIIQKMLQNQLKSKRNIVPGSFIKAIQVLHQILTEIQSIQKIQQKVVMKIIQTTFNIGNLEDKSEDKQAKQLSINVLLDIPKIQDFLILGLIKIPHSKVRRQFSVKFCTLCTTKSPYINFSKLYKLFFQPLLSYSVKFDEKLQLRDYFNMVCFVLANEDHTQPLTQYLKTKQTDIFQRLFKLIKNEQGQTSSQNTNVSLFGYLNMIRSVLSIASENQLEKLYSYVYNDCLFLGNSSKCKSKESKQAAFSVLQKIIKIQTFQQKIIESFSKLHQKGQWRTRKLEDWIISQVDRLKSASGYVGLKNLGCICYMNSFFQQIFMIQQFRMALLLCDDPYYKDQEVHENVLYQVKKMFINLMYSDKKAYNPKSFCVSFKDYEGNPTNVNEQMDIDQFSGILFDRLENNMKGTKYQNVIKNTFGGIFSNQIICKGCPHFSQTEQTFLSISLTVKDKKNVYQSFDTMIKGDTLDGDNAYFCERCSKKVSAVKRVSLKKLPNYLIVTLKRFQFDYQTMTKQKINQYCEFPVDLNLMEYSRDFLRKKQNPKFVQDEQPKPKSYFQYKLKGVVIHMGYADSGHYYSFIQQRNGDERWFQFNDTQVRKFNPETMAQQAFGGQTGGIDSKQKIKNAYMLIYQRVEKINSIKQNLVSSKQLIPSIKMYNQIFETIKQQNIVYKIESLLFSSEYLKFFNSLIQSAKSLQLQKFVILAFLTVVVRSRSDPGPFETLQKIHKAFVQDNVLLCDWILNQFVNLHIYDQFFKNNPLKDMRKTIGYWLIQVFNTSKDQSAKKMFLKQIILKITIQNQNTIEPLTIIYHLIQNKKVLDYVNSKHIIGRILQNMVRKDPRVFGSVQDVSIPQKKESYFGFQTVIERTPYQIAKKPKYQNQNAYAFGIIYKIISKHSVKQLKLNKVITNIEIDYLYLPTIKIYKILQQLKSKFQIEIFTSYLSYLSNQNAEFSSQVINLSQKGLKQYQAKRYRQFFILFQKFISIPDSLTANRMSWIKKIVKGLKENQKYAMDCTIIQLWICKIINDNDPLRQYLIKEKQILQYLVSLPMKKIPSDQLSKKNATFSDTLISKLHGIPFPLSKKAYTKILKQVQKFYEQLSAGVYERLQFFEEGPDVTNSVIKKGAQLAYFDQKEQVDYDQIKVQNIFLHKLLITYTDRNQKAFWIWQDDQKLTENLKVIKKNLISEQNSSKTTQMDGDEIDFPETIPNFPSQSPQNL